MNRIAIPIAIAVFSLSIGCKHKVGSGTPGQEGAPSVRQSIQFPGATQSLAVDKHSVYTCQGSSSASEILKSTFDGVTTSLVHLGSDCRSLTSDDVSLYWITSSGALMTMSVNGGAASTLSSGSYSTKGMAARGGKLYWPIVSEGGGIASMPSAGGVVTTLATGLTTPSHLAVDDTNVYSVVNRGNSFDVVKVPVAGGVATTLATEVKPVTGIVSDGSSIYWLTRVSGMAGAAMSVPIAGGTPVSIAQTGGPTAPQLSDTDLLWGDDRAQGIVRIPLNGGSPSTIFADITADDPFLTDGANNFFWDVVSSDPSGFDPTITYVYEMSL